MAHLSETVKTLVQTDKEEFLNERIKVIKLKGLLEKQLGVIDGIKKPKEYCDCQ